MRSRLVACLVVLVSVAGLGGMAFAPGASAATSYYVTFVARNCPHYSDIYANKARNDIVESLQDLGPDSQYGNSGALVSPAYEDLAPQTNCKPLPNWKFTLGTNYQTRAVTGAWGSLSRVTGPYATSIVTQPSTPLLDDHGNPVGNQTIAGAVTIKLTDAQATQASKASSLWAQGGTPDDPVLASEFGTPQNPDFGLGTIRCATDNVNGDNVEYIFFPSGTTHVFCYGYYVSPPPTSGTIVIHKEVTGIPTGAPNPSFHFLGGRKNVGGVSGEDDVSYDPNGFTLQNHGSTSDFYRGGDHTWVVTEEPTSNYRLDHVDCTPGSDTSTVGTTEKISLRAGEKVECTFFNAFVEPTASLTIDKITLGGASAPLDREPFEFTVTNTADHSVVMATTHTTAPGVPAAAQGLPTTLPDGDYTVGESSRPVDPRGGWELVHSSCITPTRSRAGRHRALRRGRQARAGDVPFTIGPTQPHVVCTFENQLTSPGAIKLSKVTVGGTGTAAFVIQSTTANDVVQYAQHATTTHEGLPATDAVANAVSPRATTDNDTSHIPLGTYLIFERPPLTTASGTWALVSVQCDGSDIPFGQGVIRVTLTRAHPQADCRFTNMLDHFPQPPDPEPSEPPRPVPPGTPGTGPAGTGPGRRPGVAGTVYANLAVSTEPRQSGHRIDDRIVVTNHGPSDAEGVTVDYQAPAGTRLVSVHVPRGECSHTLPLTCQTGTLRPGHKLTLAVVLSSANPPHDFSMHATVGSSTFDPRLANNSVNELLHIESTGPAVTMKPPPPQVTG